MSTDSVTRVAGRTASERFDGVALAQRLIRFPSLNPPGDEAPCIEYLVELLEAHGIETKTYEFAPGRSSIVARIEGSGDEPPLCFTGHIDVVPVGDEPWSVPPFDGTIVGDKLYGRGSSDMKAGVAAFVAATIERRAHHQQFARGITLVITGGEETGCEGAFHLARAGVLGKTALLVVAEPSSNELIIAHKGSLRISVRVRGRTAHSSMPEIGDNAVNKAARMIGKLQDHLFAVPAHHLLGATTACVTTISGGLNINSVPDSATFTVDFRTIPAHAHGELLAEVSGLFGDEADITLVTDFPGFSTDPAEPAISRVMEAVAGRTGKQPSLRGAPYFTDASALVPAFEGAPAVVLGPGEVEQCHRTDEFCFVEKIRECQEIYSDLIERYCQ